MVSDLVREASLNIHEVIDLSASNNMADKVYLETFFIHYVVTYSFFCQVPRRGEIKNESDITF